MCTDRFFSFYLSFSLPQVLCAILSSSFASQSSFSVDTKLEKKKTFNEDDDNRNLIFIRFEVRVWTHSHIYSNWFANSCNPIALLCCALLRQLLHRKWKSFESRILFRELKRIFFSVFRRGQCDLSARISFYIVIYVYKRFDGIVWLPKKPQCHPIMEHRFL